MSERGNRKVIQGIVTSNSMDKTIVVKVSRRLRHPLYGKFIKKARISKLMMRRIHVMLVMR